MNTGETVRQIIESCDSIEKRRVRLENLASEEAVALVPYFVRAYVEHKLWPLDAACLVADCHPTDEQLLSLLHEDDEHTQKLGLHVLARLIHAKSFQQRSHAPLAHQLNRVLQSVAFCPKHKYLNELRHWAATHLDDEETGEEAISSPK